MAGWVSRGGAATATVSSLADGSVSDAEFERLDGVTSDLQTQIDGKAALTHASRHENGGADEIALDASQVTSGTLAAARVPFSAPGDIGGDTPGAGTFTGVTAPILASALGTLTVNGPDGMVLQNGGVTQLQIGATTTHLSAGLQLAGGAPSDAADKVGYGVADINGAGTAAEVKNYEGGASKTERVEGAGTLKVFHVARSFADDETLTLPVPFVGGVLDCDAPESNKYGRVHIGSDGSVAVGGFSSANFAMTDSDGDLCVYDGGAAPIVKNRLGSAKTIICTFRYR